jgi:hypothetical protein
MKAILKKNIGSLKKGMVLTQYGCVFANEKLSLMMDQVIDNDNFRLIKSSNFSDDPIRIIRTKTNPSSTSVLVYDSNRSVKDICQQDQNFVEK